jgi:PAS domain S-box-containing protein
VIGWNSRKYSESSFFFVLGISFLFVGAIDTIHTLGYSGMGIFQSNGSNLATSLWISARYMQSISILVGLFLINKKINKNIVTALYLIITIILFILIFLGIFPTCYDDALQSLTLFKIISEYIIIAILVVAIVFIYRLRDNFDLSVLRLIMVFIIFSIASEFAFTLYSDVFGIQNLIGHVFKIVAFYFVYKAIIEIGIEKPFKLMFRTIKQNELDLKVRTNDLEKAYSEAEQIFDASIALLIINKDYDIIKVNEPFCNLFQVNPEEIIGKNCYELVKHDFCGTKQCCMNQIFQEDKKKVEYELEYMSKNGKFMTLLVNSLPYYSHDGDFI